MNPRTPEQPSNVGQGGLVGDYRANLDIAEEQGAGRVGASRVPPDTKREPIAQGLSSDDAMPDPVGTTSPVGAATIDTQSANGNDTPGSTIGRGSLGGESGGERALAGRSDANRSSTDDSNSFGNPA